MFQVALIPTVTALITVLRGCGSALLCLGGMEILKSSPWGDKQSLVIAAAVLF